MTMAVPRTRKFKNTVAAIGWWNVSAYSHGVTGYETCSRVRVCSAAGDTKIDVLTSVV